jgi:predicted nucleic acid-binding protein
VASTFTVDASVFLNAFNPYEGGQATSQRLLAHLQDGAMPIIVPTLLLPEVAAAIGRGRNDPDLARGFATALRGLPHLIWVPLDERLAQQAADLAAQVRLRGSDAVYAAVALRFGSVLITLDREQRDRVADVVTARYPQEALEDIENHGAHE